MDAMSVGFEADFLPTYCLKHLNHYRSEYSISTKYLLNNCSSARRDQANLESVVMYRFPTVFVIT